MKLMKFIDKKVNMSGRSTFNIFPFLSCYHYSYIIFYKQWITDEFLIINFSNFSYADISRKFLYQSKVNKMNTKD